MINRDWAINGAAGFGRAVAAYFFAGALVVGCGGRNAVAVDVDMARQALETTLRAWKAGDKPDAIALQSMAITAQDFDWLRGWTLIDYEIKPGQTQDELNLRCPVHLKLRDERGSFTERDVIYVVATKPAVTVFREVGL